MLAREMGVLKLGEVALDGTRLHADASRHSAMSYERSGKIEAQLQCSVTIKVRTPVDQDEKTFSRLRRREGGARAEAQATEIGSHFP